MKSHKKTKKSLVYKVVEVRGNLLTSTYAPLEFLRIYKERKTIYPVEGTKLFCFLNPDEAKHYAKAMSSCRVYQAEATNVKSSGWLAYVVGKLEILQACFVEGIKAEHENYSSVAVCDSLKLIKKI